MPEINSATTRSIIQATYTPYKNANNKILDQTKRAWEKWRFGESLKVNTSELDTIGESSEDEKLLKVVNTIKDSKPSLGTPSALRSVKNFGELEIESMIEFGKRLISLRENIIQQLSDLFDEYVSSSKLNKDYSIDKDLDGWTESEKTVQAFKNGKIYFRSKEELIYENIEVNSTESTSSETNKKRAIGKSFYSEYKLVVTQNEKNEETRKDNTKVSSLLEWYKSKSEVSVKSPSLDVTNYLQEAIANEPDITISDYNNAQIKLLDKTRDLLTAFEKSIANLCVGWMNLERMTFTPLDAVRGELLYTVPLAPGEEVNISHKQWSNTTQEFEKIVTDYLEDYSEQGVTEKTDMSQSSNSQTQHSSQYNLGVSASGGWGTVSIDSNFGYNVSESSTQSQQFSRNQSINITRQASNRVKKENKVTFKVLSSYGNEDQTVRKIKNPYNDRVIRIDYYSLMRKWQVKLYRYGIRMTYDINIPDPGSEMLDKYIELDRLKKKVLAEEFSFDITPDMITRETRPLYMKNYGVAIEEPPQPEIQTSVSETREWASYDEAKMRGGYYKLEFRIDNNYYIQDINTSGTNNWIWFDSDGNPLPSIFNIVNKEELIGKSGDLALVYEAKGCSSIIIQMSITAKLKPEVYAIWQVKAWNAIRDAANATFKENSVKAKDRIQQLTDELGYDEDPLTLRKIEREEIMKGVLRWLFSPNINFRFVAEGVSGGLYDSNGVVTNQEVYDRILLHEEIIKFLHHAIEWENMSYILYPYFWSQPSQWNFKKFLEHPDFLHRTFLKSGAARVVLTIRPGYEQDFARFFETGSIDGDVTNSPYLTIAQEVENEAKINYPGIPAANPEEADRLNTGIEIGSWYEYTPTSALDILLR